MKSTRDIIVEKNEANQKEMFSEILCCMHPEMHSVECVMLGRAPGVTPHRDRANLGRELDPYIIAEITNPNGFASVAHGSIVLVPLNNCHFLPKFVGDTQFKRFFVKEKHIRGIVHNSGKDKRWNLDKI
jgi:hypothetical protein